MEKYKEYFTPVAILVMGAMISLSILAAEGGIKLSFEKGKAGQPAAEPAPNGDTAPSVTADDYIRGNPDAPITIVEFSDLECPFCKRFHSTLQQALAEYGDKVRWVYKHFPLDALHPKADKEAEAAECAGELGGSEKFWAYLDRVFEVTPSNNGLDPALLPQIAKDLGLDQNAFENCLNSGKFAEKVEKQYQEGVKLGVNGTPGSFVNGTPVRGALPYDENSPGYQPGVPTLKSIIEAELQKI